MQAEAAGQPAADAGKGICFLAQTGVAARSSLLCQDALTVKHHLETDQIASA